MVKEADEETNQKIMNDADKPSSDLKMALFDKPSLKKALYSCLMKRLVKQPEQTTEATTSKPICLLEVKSANEVFTVTLVLLGQKGS